VLVCVFESSRHFAFSMWVTDLVKLTSIFFCANLFQVEVEDWTEGWTEDWTEGWTEDWTEGWTEDLRIPISRYVTDFPLCHRFPVSGGIGAQGIKREIYPQRGRDSRVR
jgi:hypothetical protein